MSPTRSWAAVFFDLDGTLADTVELIVKSYRHTMDRHLGAAPPDERWVSMMGLPLRAQFQHFARNEDEAESMLRTYVAFQRREHDQMVRAFPGARQVLRSIRERGSRLGVVTSKLSDVARRTLEVCDLWDEVDVVVGADQVERAKPDPEPVVAAMTSLGIEGRPGEVLFVGDSPYDLRAGRSAGARTAAVAWGPFARFVLEAEKPDFFFERMEDVLGTGPD